MYTRVYFRAWERASRYVIAVRTERIRLIRRLSVFHGEIILSVELGTSYRARHEAEKGSTCSATEFYISPGEQRARDARERGFSLCVAKYKNENMTSM